MSVRGNNCCRKYICPGIWREACTNTLSFGGEASQIHRAPPQTCLRLHDPKDHKLSRQRLHAEFEQTSACSRPSAPLTTVKISSTLHTRRFRRYPLPAPRRKREIVKQVCILWWAMSVRSRLGVFALCAGILAVGFAVTLTQYYKAKSADSAKLEDAFTAKAGRVRSRGLQNLCHIVPSRFCVAVLACFPHVVVPR
jgi:hypothetical protein